jgi:hypothetical protein
VLFPLYVAAMLGAPRVSQANPAVYEIGDDPGVGFNLISWFNFDNAGTPAVDEGADEWEGAVQAMYNAGFREVSISPVRFFNTTTFAIAPTSTQGANLPANQPNNVPLGQWLSAFAITAVLPLAGDYNRDGIVNAADYTTWRNSLGEFVANFNAADGNGNGRIDEGD